MQLLRSTTRLVTKLFGGPPRPLGFDFLRQMGKLVLQTERPGPETDLTVEEVGPATERFIAAGGRVIVEPFDIPIGGCAVVVDPWENQLVLLDNSKGHLVTDQSGNIIGLDS